MARGEKIDGAAVTEPPSDLWYRTERTDLKPGDEIAAGNWGRVIVSQGQDHPLYYREYFVELARRVWAPHAPSRLRCGFAFPTLADAQKLRGEDCLYRVRAPVLPYGPLDMLWLSWIGEPNREPEHVISNCRSYWAGESTEAVAAHATCDDRGMSHGGRESTGAS